MGNMTSRCCAEVNARITLIGMDEVGTRELYEKITSCKVADPAAIQHYEEKVKLKSLKAHVCYIPASEKLMNLWSQHVVHSDGVIFVVDYDNKANLESVRETIKDLYSNVAQENRIVMLVLVRNGYSLDRDDLKKVCDIEERYVMVSGCEFVTWNGYDSAITWLCKNISIDQ